MGSGAAAAAGATNAAVAAAFTTGTTFAAQVTGVMAVAVATTTLTTTMNFYSTDINTTYVPPLYHCGELIDSDSSSSSLKTGRMNLAVRGEFTRAFNDQEKLIVQNLFKEIYNNVSGRCEGVYQRILERAFLEEQVFNATDSIIETKWSAEVRCNGCYDFEPLFYIANNETED